MRIRKDVRTPVRVPIHAQREAPLTSASLGTREAKIQCLLGGGQEMASLHPC